MNKNAGLSFTRSAIALGLARGAPDEAARIVMAKWGVNKAAVESGATLSGNWGNPLTDFRGQATEFFEAVAEYSVIGQLPGLRRVPPMVKCLTRIDAATAEWRGEGQPQPSAKAPSMPRLWSCLIWRRWSS